MSQAEVEGGPGDRRVGLDYIQRCAACKKGLGKLALIGSMKSNFEKYKNEASIRRRKREAEWEGRKAVKSDDDIVVAATCGELFHKSCLMQWCSSSFTKKQNRAERNKKPRCPKCKQQIMYSIHREIDLDRHRFKAPSRVETEFLKTELINQELLAQLDKDKEALGLVYRNLDDANSKLDNARDIQEGLGGRLPKSVDKIGLDIEIMRKKKREKREMEDYIQKAQRVIEMMQHETPNVMRMYLQEVQSRPLEEIPKCTPIPRMLIPYLDKISEDDTCLFALSQVLRPRSYPGLRKITDDCLLAGILNKVNPSLHHKLSLHSKETKDPDLQKAYESLFPKNSLKILESLRDIRKASGQAVLPVNSTSNSEGSDLAITIMYVMDDEDKHSSEDKSESEDNHSRTRHSFEERREVPSSLQFKAKKASGLQFSPMISTATVARTVSRKSQRGKSHVTQPDRIPEHKTLDNQDWTSEAVVSKVLSEMMICIAKVDAETDGSENEETQYDQAGLIEPIGAGVNHNVPQQANSSFTSAMLISCEEGLASEVKAVPSLYLGHPSRSADYCGQSPQSHSFYNDSIPRQSLSNHFVQDLRKSSTLTNFFQSQYSGLPHQLPQNSENQPRNSESAPTVESPPLELISNLDNFTSTLYIHEDQGNPSRKCSPVNEDETVAKTPCGNVLCNAFRDGNNNGTGDIKETTSDFLNLKSIKPKPKWQNEGQSTTQCQDQKQVTETDVFITVLENPTTDPHGRVIKYDPEVQKKIAHQDYLNCVAYGRTTGPRGTGNPVRSTLPAPGPRNPYRRAELYPKEVSGGWADPLWYPGVEETLLPFIPRGDLSTVNSEFFEIPDHRNTLQPLGQHGAFPESESAALLSQAEMGRNSPNVSSDQMPGGLHPSPQFPTKFIMECEKPKLSSLRSVKRTHLPSLHPPKSSKDLELTSLQQNSLMNPDQRIALGLQIAKLTMNLAPPVPDPLRRSKDKLVSRKSKLRFKGTVKLSKPPPLSLPTVNVVPRPTTSAKLVHAMDSKILKKTKDERISRVKSKPSINTVSKVEAWKAKPPTPDLEPKERKGRRKRTVGDLMRRSATTLQRLLTPRRPPPTIPVIVPVFPAPRVILNGFVIGRGPGRSPRDGKRGRSATKNKKPWRKIIFSARRRKPTDD